MALVISPATGPNPPAPFPIREGGAGPAFLLAYSPSRVGKGLGLGLLPAGSVTKAELVYGAHKSAKVAENLQKLETFFTGLDSLPFDDPAAGMAGEIRATLDRQGQQIGPNDLLIASIALAYGLTLVSHNTGEFGRVPGLRLEDWEAEP